MPRVPDSNELLRIFSPRHYLLCKLWKSKIAPDVFSAAPCMRPSLSRRLKLLSQPLVYLILINVHYQRAYNKKVTLLTAVQAGFLCLLSITLYAGCFPVRFYGRLGTRTQRVRTQMIYSHSPCHLGSCTRK